MFFFILFSFFSFVFGLNAQECNLPTNIPSLDKSIVKTIPPRIKIGTNFSFSCMPGYTESSTQISCFASSNRMPTLSHVPKCIQQTCVDAKNANKYKFSLYAKFFLRQVPNEIDLATIFISFDPSKKLPQYSISLIDQLNSYQNVNREDALETFILHPCRELQNKQTADKEYTNNGYDRGHLTPFNINRFSRKAARSSNLMVNIAPQDSFTNRNLWSQVELKLAGFLSNKYGIVVTGVCSELLTSIRGLNVPSCFWKLVCFKKNSRAIVFGFMHNNTLVKTENDKITRSSEVNQLRTFNFVKEKLKSNRNQLDWNTVWKDAEVLIHSRKVNFDKTSIYPASFANEYPNLKDCASAGDFPEEFKNEWSGNSLNRKRPFEDPKTSGKTKKPRIPWIN